LFMCVGVRYDRHHTRRVTYYGGVATTMPMFVFIFRFFTMANIALPGTSAFVGEYMIRLGIVDSNVFVTVISTSGIILGGAYSRWLYNRVSYGNVKPMYVGGVYVDVNRREMLMFVPLMVFTLVRGVYPSGVCDYITISCVDTIVHVKMSV
jgi:NADH-quinone oxidoreductase subunit M